MIVSLAVVVLTTKNIIVPLEHSSSVQQLLIIIFENNNNIQVEILFVRYMHLIKFTLLMKEVYLSMRSKSIRSAISTPGEPQECDL